MSEIRRSALSTIAQEFSWQVTPVSAGLPSPADDYRYRLTGHCFKKAVVMTFDLLDANAEQGQGKLFKREERCSADELMRSIDAANKRFGAGTVFFAAQGVKQGWKMRRELMSPYYTTRMNDIPHVK